MSWFDRCSVVAEQGELTDSDSAALGFGVKTTLLPYGAVAKAVLSKGGPRLAERFSELHRDHAEDPLQLGQTVTLRDVELGARTYHLVLVGYWAEASEYTPALVSKAYAGLLRGAFDLGVSSFAVPLLGGKPWANRFPRFCETVTQLLREFDRLRVSADFALDELTFVSTQRDQVDVLNAHLARLG